MIQNIKFGKNVNKLGLSLSYDKKKHPVLFIGMDDINRVFMKKFCGRFDLDKFLVEAVLLRMSADKKNINDVRDFYNRLCSFIVERETENE